MNYVNQKYTIECDPRFTIPKLKYKGTTVQYQRIKVKKGAKIQEMNSSSFISEEERIRMEKQGIEEQKLKEALAEKKPEWALYCYMGSEEIGTEKYWIDMIQR